MKQPTKEELEIALRLALREAGIRYVERARERLLEKAKELLSA